MTEKQVFDKIVELLDKTAEIVEDDEQLKMLIYPGVELRFRGMDDNGMPYAVDIWFKECFFTFIKNKSYVESLFSTVHRKHDELALKRRTEEKEQLTKEFFAL